MPAGLVRKLLRAVLAGLVLYVIALGYLAWDIRIRTNIDSYERYLAVWNQGLVGHFPLAIETKRRDARVTYFPGFLQGGAHLQLGVPVSVETAVRAESTYSIRAVHVFRGEWSRMRDAPGRDVVRRVPVPPYRLGPDRAVTEFPERFTIYYLFVRPGTTHGFPWNHGNTAGVAISKEPPEVIYWAESW